MSSPSQPFKYAHTNTFKIGLIFVFGSFRFWRLPSCVHYVHHIFIRLFKLEFNGLELIRGSPTSPYMEHVFFLVFFLAVHSQRSINDKCSGTGEMLVHIIVSVYMRVVMVIVINRMGIQNSHINNRKVWMCGCKLFHVNHMFCLFLRWVFQM